MSDARVEPEYDFVVVEPADVTSPKTLAFLDHCRRLQGDRPFPRWRDFHLAELPNDVLPYAAVIDVVDDPPSFVYRFWGTGHTALKGVDHTGKAIDDLPSEHLARIGVRQCMMILEQRRPLIFVHSLRDYKDWTEVVQVAARVPLSDNGVTIDKIVSYSNYDEDREAWAEVYRKLISPPSED